MPPGKRRDSARYAGECPHCFTSLVYALDDDDAYDLALTSHVCQTDRLDEGREALGERVSAMRGTDATLIRYAGLHVCTRSDLNAASELVFYGDAALVCCVRCVHAAIRGFVNPQPRGPLRAAYLGRLIGELTREQRDAVLAMRHMLPDPEDSPQLRSVIVLMLLGWWGSESLFELAFGEEPSERGDGQRSVDGSDLRGV